MRSIACVILLLTLLSYVFAGDVQFTAFDNGDGTFSISYVVTGGTIRGMALNIDADVDVKAVTVDSYFDFFPDAAYGDPDNYALGAGTPIANQEQAGEIALPSNSFCISMGNVEGVATVDELTIASIASGRMTLSVNTFRGGIVDTEGNPMTSNLPLESDICPSSCCGQCGAACCISQVDMDDWCAVGLPASWCAATQCYGNADGAKEAYGRNMVDVGMVDVDILVSGFRKPNSDANFATWIAADFDRRAEPYGRGGTVRVGMADVAILVANFRKPIASDCNY